MAKCTLRSLHELTADFKRRCGSDSKDTSLPDELWEVPSDVPSEDDWNEDQSYNPRVTTTKPSKRTALSSLDKLQEKFKARQQEREKTSTKQTSGGVTQPKSPGRVYTGTLTKLVERKGFGFIAPDVEGTGDVFLHCSELLGASCGDMFVGMRVRCDVEVDSRSGKTRARNAVILEAESNVAQVTEKRTLVAGAAPDAQDVAKKGKEPGHKARANAHFTRAQFLGFFQMLGRPYGKASKLGIFSVRFPKIPRQQRWGYSDSDSESDSLGADSSWMEEDACLDDEDLIAAMEIRLSKESGFDVLNKETFGESCSSGWSFEEAVMANAKLASSHLSAGLGPFGTQPRIAEELEEFGCGPTTAGGSADGADTMDSPALQSRAESPGDVLEADAVAPAATASLEAVPRYILEGLQLQ